MKAIPRRLRHKRSGRILALAGIGVLSAGAISLAIWLFGKLLALMWISIVSTAIVAMTGCGSSGR